MKISIRTIDFSDGVALVGRFHLSPLSDFSRVVGDFDVFSRGDVGFEPLSPFGLFTFVERVPEAGRFDLICSSCSFNSLSLFCFHAFNDVG